MVNYLTSVFLFPTQTLFTERLLKTPGKGFYDKGSYCTYHRVMLKLGRCLQNAMTECTEVPVM